MEDLALINRVREMLSGDPVKTDNFCFQRHDCPVSGENISVGLDFKLMDEKNGKITLLGMCPHCKAVYYHNDTEKKSWE